MKPHPRIRKTIKWGGAAATVLLIGMWIGSIWWRPFRDSDDLTLEIREGCLCLNHYPHMYARLSGTEDEPSWGVQPLEGRFFCLRPAARFRDSGIWHVRLPLWMPTVLAAGLTGFVWRLDNLARRRARLNLCPKCSYDRAGIAGDAKCPECGAMPVVSR